jgi:hypothetical protein
MMVAMYACPHCSERTITAWKKSGASDLWPARCPLCNGLARLSGWAGFSASLAADFAFWVPVVAGLALRSWIVFLVLLIGFHAAIFFGVLKYARLYPTDPAQVRKARWRALWKLCLLVAVVAIAYAIFGRASG